MGVDKTRENEMSGGVQLLGTGRAGELAANGHDLIGLDQDIGRF
jgi:hypothetical protein